ncbi:hypothetical protein JZ751_011246 [Albula glossodonta]|uniref:Uncharacterized protein n=1 Tax=Albula glossodonta TaxID=121402 RepID=A0A8T2NWQ3_9TELE|nr:hypothetical protein JZ751_011246 [Albula glossodonta]
MPAAEQPGQGWVQHGAKDIEERGLQIHGSRMQQGYGSEQMRVLVAQRPHQDGASTASSERCKRGPGHAQAKEPLDASCKGGLWLYCTQVQTKDAVTPEALHTAVDPVENEYWLRRFREAPELHQETPGFLAAWGPQTGSQHALPWGDSNPLQNSISIVSSVCTKNLFHIVLT